MNKVKFLEVDGEHSEQRDKTLWMKSEEYASTDNVLAQFQRLSKKTGRSPEEVAYDYLTKHYEWLGEMVKKLSAGGNFTQIADKMSESPEEKVGDIENYCRFIKAMFYLRRKGIEE